MATLFAEYPLFAFAGASVVLLPFIGIMFGRGTTGWTHLILIGVSVALVVLLAALFSLLAATGGVIRDISVQIPKNRFGLCSGSSGEIPIRVAYFL